MQYADRLDLTGSQSPEQIGRAIAALADDLDLLNLTRRGRSASMLRPSRTGSTYGVDPPAARSPQCAALTVTARAGRLRPHPEQPDMRGRAPHRQIIAIRPDRRLSECGLIGERHGV
jgi:hypothetical protein